MEDLKKKINFDPSLLYYSPNNKESKEDEKPSVTNVETYNSTNRKHVCTVCGKRFFSLSALNIHMEHHSPNERPSVEKDNDNANLNRKNQYVWDKGIKCDKLECNFIALDAVEYSKHISSCEGKRVLKEGENVSFCELCDSYFSSENHFKAHLVLQHPDCDPDISLKEYDAKYTTISDPVSLYVSENNAENDSDVKQTKVACHSKYPDSFISKKKLKDIEIEEIQSSKQTPGKTLEEATTSTSNETLSAMGSTVEVDKLNVPPVDDSLENSTAEITERIDNSKGVISNDQSARPLDDKNDVISEKTQSLAEKCDDTSSDIVAEIVQKTVTESKSNEAEKIGADFDMKTENEKSEEDLIVDSTNDVKIDEKPVLDDAIIKVKLENEVNLIAVEGKPSEEINDEMSKQRSEENVPEISISSDKTVSNESTVSSTKSSQKEPELKENVKNREYMNVEKMMYNLFQDENASENASKKASGEVDKSKNEDTSSDIKRDQNKEEIRNILSETPTKTQKEHTDQEDIKKEDSDFEDFNYSCAGKKKYLKSYSRLKKGKTPNEVTNAKSIETPEETCAISNPLSSTNRTSTKEPHGSNVSKLTRTETKLENQDDDANKSTEWNVKERSTRTRKKLILPDFEYDSDYKSYCSLDIPPKRSESGKKQKSNEAGGVKKRGRPRKSITDVSISSIECESVSSMDVASNNVSKSMIEIKDKIENSYLNTSETSTKLNTPNDTIQYAENLESSACSQISNIVIPDDSEDNEEELSKSDMIVDISSPTNTVKRKRGRPRKIKKEKKSITNKAVPAITSTADTRDKSAEENIDLANALLSLSGNVTDKSNNPEILVKQSLPQNSNNKPVAIIKKKKSKFLKLANSGAKSIVLQSASYEKKDEVEKNKQDTPARIVNNVSFDNANKLKKNQQPEVQTSFMNDISLVANVSTPKKRGRPPKNRKESDTCSDVSPEASVISKTTKSLQLAEENEQQKVDKPLESKSADRKNVFLKKKLTHTKIRSHLDALSFSLLQNNPSVKKRGRPPKIFKEKSDESKDISKKDIIQSTVDKESENEDNEDMVVHYIQNQNDEIIEPRNISKLSNDSSCEELDTTKRKKGRPPKMKSINVKKKTTSRASNEEHDKDLNLNDLEKSQDSGEDLSFANDNYHPKKKRSKIDGEKSVDEVADIDTDEEIPKKASSVVKSKPSVSIEPKDETYAINKDLYLNDMKNRAKHGKLFKKPKNFVYDEKYTDDMMITCGRCKMRMTFRHYKNCHQISHYYVCWIEGDPEINLNDDAEITRALQSAITPEALRKKAIRLTCEKCSDVRKSVVGYVSHIRFCQKEDKNDLFETCKLCGRVLRPSSIRFHYIKFHGTTKWNRYSDGFNSSQIDISESAKDEQDDSDDTKTNTSHVKRYRMGFTRKFLQKKDIIDDEEFWTALKTSYDLYMCMGLSCKHMTLSKDDLKSHILHCGANFCEFSCSSCPYKTKYENEIIYHSKKKCQGDSEDEQKDKSVSIERRVSTRKKKRKFNYDCTELNDTSEDDKNQNDRDFQAGPISDEDEYDSDMEERKLRSKRRRSDRLVGDSINDKSGLRSAFQQYCSGRSDPLRWTVDLRLKLFSSTPLHPYMKVNTKEWETVPSSEVEKYIPTHQKSMKVHFDSVTISQFELFQADVIKGIPVCFVGGPVWAMAWAPLPAQMTEQFLAVSTLQHMNQIVEINYSVIFPSLIQFWKFSSIDNISNDIQKPTLGWSIAHNFGAVWSMEWCPSGGFNNLSSTCRLGILAAATSAGCVIVYNIPKLENSGDISTDLKSIVTNPKPDLVLKVRNENVQCTRVVWDHTSPHNSVIGGFSDGSVAFWNINTASVLLKKGSVFYPYRTFEAHNAPITALDLHWLYNGRFLLTGSTDKTTKYWDLKDLSGPMYEYERSTAVLSATWMQHWIVTANVHDFGTVVGETGAYIAHPRDSIEKKKTIMNARDAFWSISYSLWNDMVAVSSNGGLVGVYAAKHLSLLTYKHPEFEKVVTSTELVALDEEEKKDLDIDALISGMPATDNLFDCSSIVQNNAIRFSEKPKNKSGNETVNFDLEKCSPLSVNKVSWNQNYNSFNWLAVGYECGFIRVVRIERFDKHYLTKFYKTNENTATLM